MLINEIVVLGIATLILLALLLILLIYLIIRKALEIKNRKQLDQLKEEYQPILFSYISSGPLTRKIQTDTLAKKKAVEELLGRFSDLLEEKQMNERLTAFAEQHLGKLYQKQLRSRSWSIRMNTLSYIDGFQMKSMLPYIIKILEKASSSDEEKILCLRILASFQESQLVDYLNQAAFLSDSDYRNILIRLDKKRFDLCVLNYHKSHENMKYAILDVIGIKKELDYTSFLNHIFQSSNGEERIRSLKAIANVGYIKEPEKILPLAESDRWEERMIAARIFGIIKDPHFIPLLVSLIHDQNWWVRSEAGASLLSFPSGRDILQDISKHDEDRFARDMAWQWLHKGVI
ncbi:HEAT repeat domain-containing protein [Peribacillus saganii]|uniref:HEAT repeat domain-containing protein n=1 Tax=Peribacillus saganii TaxID=2303992 RepID=A0A372LLA0_9BACI|nr:HEAT repeat domain-containing protein [Peribacillus saganii]RFU67532.1 HEAT repeat domain-containing protein [Peribacillus saganii]